jgi:hypothetical protein
VITSPTNSPYDRDGQFTISGTAEPNSDVRLREGTEYRGGGRAGPNGAWSAQLTGIPDGSHTYVAEALDGAGNTSAASNAVTVRVDSAPPETTIDSGPSGLTNATSATFQLSSEPGATFECRLTRSDEDPSQFGSCESSKVYTELAQGDYAFEARAADAAGNPDPTPATRLWTINTAGPAMSAFAPQDASKTRNKRPTIKATVTDDAPLDVSDLALFVNDKPASVSGYRYDPATGAFSYRPKRDMKPGKKTVRLIATDDALNEETATWSFTVRK